MSAAAHLLKRRSGVLPQHRRKVLSLLTPSLVPALQYRSPPSTLRYRNFSATTTSKSEEGSSKRGLILTAAATSVLLLSSAAWYAKRDEYSQVQHVGLPQVFHRPVKEDGVLPIPTDEKTSQHLDLSSQTEEELVKGVTATETQVLITNVHDQVDEGQLIHKVDESTVSIQFGGNGDEQFGSAPSQPQPDPGQMSGVIEQESERTDEYVLPKDRKQKLQVFKDYEQEHLELPSFQETEQGSSKTFGSSVDAANENLSDVSEDYQLHLVIDAIEDQDARDDLKNKEKIRENLRRDNPEMFYSDSASDDKDDGLREKGGDGKIYPETLEILENENHEYDPTHRVPSILSPSDLVQRGHEESVRRYSDKEMKDKFFSGISREEQPFSDGRQGVEENNVVGVDVLVGAIHTAKQLQAEVDGQTFREHFNKLQEDHQREVSDFQARIFAYAEDTDQLVKELTKEKEGAAAALKLQKEISEHNMKVELNLKDEEAANERERIQLLGQAQTAALISREKADRLNDIHSVQLQLDALRTAFYTRSEEARISHTAHKLAMGAFALEEAIERGDPVNKEVGLLIASAGGPGVDPLVDAVVSSLPSEVLTAGTRTRAQLHQKFTKLKGSLRELALMPAGGGGVFAHFLAKFTANLKISEQGSDYVQGDGIEVVIGKVERFLAEEKLMEAAALLERGAKGTAAEGLAVEWALQVRNRAIIEQGVQVLRAHVISVASGLA